MDIDAEIGQVAQLVIRVYSSGGSCAKKRHHSKDEVMKNLPKRIDRDVAGDEFDWLVQNGFLYNYGGHSYALTDKGLAVCREIRKRMKKV